MELERGQLGNIVLRQVEVVHGWAQEVPEIEADVPPPARVLAESIEDALLGLLIEVDGNGESEGSVAGARQPQLCCWDILFRVLVIDVQSRPEVWNGESEIAPLMGYMGKEEGCLCAAWDGEPVLGQAVEEYFG